MNPYESRVSTQSYSVPANLSQISTLAAEAEAAGANHGDILMAVGKDLPNFNGLGVFCYANGMLIRLMGAWPLVLIEAVALIALFDFIARYTEDVLTWAKNKFGSVLTILAAISGTVGLGWLAFKWLTNDEKDGRQHSSAGTGAIATSALKGFIIGLFPGPIQGALMAVAIEVGGTLGIGQGGGAPEPTIIERQPLPTGPAFIAPQPQMADADDDDPEDGVDLDEATVQRVADSLGVPTSQVYDMIAGA